MISPLALAVAAVGGVLLDPVQELAHPSVHTWGILLGASIAEGHHTGELVATLVDDQWAATVALAGVLATLLDQAGAEHHLGDLVLVAGLAAGLVADNWHVDLLQVVRSDTTLLNQTPAGDNSL